MTDTEILNWLIANDVIAIGNFMGGQTDRVRTASGCGCCTDTLDTPPDVLARLTTPENVEEPSCTCPRFSDTGGYRIADLTCPTHGVGGTDPGDGMWTDTTPENVECPT